MFNYEKRLEYPIKIKRTDARMAKAIITQFGGPDGETGASMRYLSQRFTMPYREVMGILTDIGTSVSIIPSGKHFLFSFHFFQQNERIFLWKRS